VCGKAIRRQRPFAIDLIETKRDHPQNNGECVSNRMYLRIRVTVVSVKYKEMWNIGG
jgi:hypothetical protein